MKTMFRLGNIAEVLAGQAAPNKFSHDGFPFIRAGHLEDLISGLELSKLPKVSAIEARKNRLKLLPLGSLIFAKSGMSATKNRIYITDSDAYIVSHLAAVVPSHEIHTQYLQFYLSWYNPSRLILDESYPSIRLADISNLQIPLPPLPVQQKIAAILDAADLHRQKTKTLIEKYDQLTQSIFLEMFGDPVRNEKGWELKSLEDLVAKNCPLTYGIVQPGDHIDGGVPCVRPVDLLKRTLALNGLKRISKSISSKFSRTILRGGEILISVRGSIGLLSIADHSLAGCNVTRGIVPIWFDDSNFNKLFFYYLYKTKSIQNQIKEKSKGIALVQINLGDLRKIPFITPSIEIQNLFAQRIQNIENQIDQANLSLQKSENLFNTLLQRAFKGELVN